MVSTVDKLTMKRSIYILVLLTAALVKPVWADSLKSDNPVLFDNLRLEVFDPYFEALQDGNVALLYELMPKLQKPEYQALLHDNTTYPNFLKEHYAGSMFTLVDVFVEDNEYQASVEIVWQDGRVSTLPVRIDKFAADTKLHR